MIARADGYVSALRAAQIEADPAERRAAVLEQVKGLAASVHGVITDESILDEVTNLVECPTALVGTFEAAHLALPRDVLISVMKKHQRYFPVEQGGRLLPYFIAVRNGDDQHLDLVREGNEHVIQARFADANFFVREDPKLKLEDSAPAGDVDFPEETGLHARQIRAGGKADRPGGGLAPAVGGRNPHRIAGRPPEQS